MNDKFGFNCCTLCFMTHDSICRYNWNDALNNKFHKCIYVVMFLFFNVINIFVLTIFMAILVIILSLLNSREVIIAIVPFTTPFEIFIFFVSIITAWIATYLIWLNFGSCNQVCTFSIFIALISIVTSKISLASNILCISKSLYLSTSSRCEHKIIILLSMCDQRLFVYEI